MTNSMYFRVSSEDDRDRVRHWLTATRNHTNSNEIEHSPCTNLLLGVPDDEPLIELVERNVPGPAEARL